MFIGYSIKTEQVRNLIRKNSIYNLVTQVITVIAVMLMIPIILTGLGDEKYGVFSIIILIINTIVIFDLGINKATIKYISKFSLELNHIEIGTTLVRSVIIQTLLGLFLFFIIVKFKHDILTVINVNRTHQEDILKVIVYVGYLVPVLFVSVSLRSVLEGIQAFDVVSIIKSATNILSYAIAILSTINGFELSSIVIYIIIIRVIGLLLYFYFINRRISYIFSLKSLFYKKTALIFFKYSGWIALLNIAVALISNMDKFIITHYLGASSLTNFVIPFEILYGLWIIPGAIIAAMFPALCVERNENDLKDLLNKVIQIILIALTTINTILILFSYEIISIWQSKIVADNSSLILSILLIGQLINSVGWIPSTILIAKDQARSVFFAYCIDLIIFIIVLIFAVKMYGVLGASVVFVVRSSAEVLALFILLKTYSKQSSLVMYKNTKIIFLTSLIIVSISLILSIGIEEIIYKFIFLILILLVFIMISIKQSRWIIF